MPTSSARLHIHMLYDLPIGAYHHYCAQLCNALIANPEVEKVALTAVFAERHRPDVDPDERELVDPRVDMVVLGPGGGSKFSRYVAFFGNLAQHLRQISNDGRTVLHLHTATGLNLLDLGLLLAYRLKGIPVVRTIHELTAAERSAQPSAFALWFGRLLLRLTSAVIVHDARTGQRVRDLLQDARKPVARIPHGHYLVFRQYIQGQLHQNHQAIPVLLFLGIKRHKGIEVFLDAMQQLQNEHYTVKGVITGRVNAGDEDLIERIQQLSNVELDASYQPNRDIWRIYDQADVVMMPYLKGTTSGAVHLAYAFERPVIVSDIECFQDIVLDGETGVVTRRGNVDDLVAAIKRLCSDKALCLAMGQAGFKLVSSEAYDWNRIAEMTVAAYQQALTKQVA